MNKHAILRKLSIHHGNFQLYTAGKYPLEMTENCSD